jgi:hypothetical protein
MFPPPNEDKNFQFGYSGIRWANPTSYATAILFFGARSLYFQTEMREIRPVTSIRTLSTESSALSLQGFGGEILQLNPTAAWIWRRLTEGASSAEIIHSLAEISGISEQQVSDDFATFEKELKDRFLVYEE